MNTLLKNDARILMHIGQHTDRQFYASLLLKELNLCDSCCSKRINSLIRMKLLVRKTRVGVRRRMLYLTARGKKVVKELFKAHKILTR